MQSQMGITVTNNVAVVLKNNAEVAQLVEHNLAKVRVASSSLVFRSKSLRIFLGLFFCPYIFLYGLMPYFFRIFSRGFWIDFAQIV